MILRRFGHPDVNGTLGMDINESESKTARFLCHCPEEEKKVNQFSTET